MKDVDLFARLREGVIRLWGTLRRKRSDHDLEQEIAIHLELAEEELQRQGRSTKDAARLARIRVGNSPQVMETLRDQRGIPALSTYWLDTKLGLRMLRKSWGLTLIGGFTLVAAMTIGASVFNVIGAMTEITLPLEEGDRVVVIQPSDGGQRRNSSPEDFARWRSQLHSLQDVGAFQTVSRNLVIANGPPARIMVAEMSAAGFQLTRIAPLMGRYLLNEDEQAAATPVLVISYDAWESKFAANPKVVGQQVRLNGVFHTVVGVMPPKFAFPVNHDYWTSLKRDAAAPLVVFGRLSPGSALESAQAEAEAMGLLKAKPDGGASRELKPRVVPYIDGIGHTRKPNALTSLLLPVVLALLLIPPCANIAILIYARTVARQGEFAARAALGADRGRIVAQILIEVFLLSALAAGLAVVFASKLTVLLKALLTSDDLPFWVDFGLSYQTILFAAALAVLAAMIAGGIPALRATGRWKVSGLHALQGGTAPRLGKMWTAVVVAQIALAVAAVPTVSRVAWSSMRTSVMGPGFKAEEFLTARLEMDPQGPSTAPRFNAARAEMVRQLRLEPGLRGVTMSEAVPFEEQDLQVEANRAGITQKVQPERKSVAVNGVDEAFFDAFAITLLTGRRLEPGDADPGRGAIVVNASFVSKVLGNGNPLGRHVRVVGSNDEPAWAAGPEYEVVGVVRDLFVHSQLPTIYRPLASDVGTTPAAGTGSESHHVRLALHAGRTIPPKLASRLREMASAIDPTLRVDDIQTLSDVYRYSSMGDYGAGIVIGTLTLCGVLFSVAGIYTSMAFAVVQRRREIGIRSALGASPWRLIAGVFRQVLLPVGFGVPFGGLAALLLDFYISPLLFDGARPLPWMLPAAEAFIVLVAAVALAGPTRRALRVNPVEALRE